jgi:hypothetical protein
MNKEQFVAEYRNRIVELNAFFADDIDSTDEDRGLSAPNLINALEAEDGLVDVLTAFRLSGKNLADIVHAIGGSEMYEFYDISLLEDIRLLGVMILRENGIPSEGEIGADYGWLTDHLSQVQIPVAVVRRWMKERGIAEVEADRFASFWDHQEHYAVSVDIALGGIIHARHIITLQSYNCMLPGGDDTYYDYYPGDMLYYSAVMDWFLNDGPRMS